MNPSFFKRIKEMGGLKVGIILITYFILLWNFSTVVGVINKIGVVLTPFAYGFVLAYIINPIISGIRKLFFKITKKELNYTLSMILSYLIVLSLFVFLVVSIIPQLWFSIDSIIKEIPNAVETAYKWLETDGSEYIKKISHNQVAIEDITEHLATYLNTFSENITVGIGKIANFAFGVSKFVLSCILGLIISIYMLMHKDKYKGQAVKAAYALLSKEKAERFINFSRTVHTTFTGFLSAKSLDSLIIGILCYIGCLILGFKNAILIAVLVGVTNMVPYFGPFIGAIPSALIILMQGPKEMLIFIIFILILQQFDGNILGPKLLGSSMGLTSLWVIFALIIMTAIFGVFGMIIGVPLFTVIYMWIKDVLYEKLRQKGLSTDTEEYVDKEYWKKTTFIVKGKSKKKKKEKKEEENKEQ